MRVLVTGGAGYIGSHTSLALLEAGHDVIVADNLSRGSARALDRVAELAGRKPAFARADVRDRVAMHRLLAEERPEAVVHFAGLKAVGESVRDPLGYWDNNVLGSVNLVGAMQEAGVHTLVFSSSATVYGELSPPPFREEFPMAPTNPYGETKATVERMLASVAATRPGWRIAVLRYFNPVGAHASGRLGEDPNATSANLMPAICRAASGGDALAIHGDDYPTPDGTALRDYLHVADLAEGHVRALQAVRDFREPATTINLGRGVGQSVREVIHAFEQASGVRVPANVAPRRAGDVAVLVADPARAQALLGWKARRSLEEMCRDAWQWHQRNPNGYA
ncbi:UDP-glucose 4-epimerase GalE [Usitatibacter palustris]|uniref:UDP-glucose 4-epimerase n=1 Tax=Usitatibacter palustris TaxID=2732487 RepID=A0A6M4H7T7_9PROT|nr:UDP-glucose 4-epimerase GalE [Usitatibacter palustris]QJR15681.1 UDP-glucose 4-epimerase [Usitatibacter palustris]